MGADEVWAAESRVNSGRKNTIVAQRARSIEGLLGLNRWSDLFCLRGWV
jgi:hypothetical protein